MRGVLSGGLLVALTAVLVLAWHPAWWPGMVGVAFAAGGLLVVTWRQQALSFVQVLALALLLRVLFLALPPVLSDDGYRYVWDGLVQVQEGVNPYRYAPEASGLEDLQDTSIYEHLNSAAYHSVYPPGSQAVFAMGALLYEAFGGRASFYLINALFALMEAGTLGLLYRLHTHSGRAISTPPREQRASFSSSASLGAFLLYALHPLVLLEGAGQGHTEAGAALFLVLTVWWARSGKARWASVALAAATLFKLYPLVLFPFLGSRFKWRGLWPGALTGVLGCLPYAAGANVPEVWASLDLYVRLFEFNAGPYYALKELFDVFTGKDWSKTLGPVLRWMFLAGLPVLYWLDRRFQWSLAQAFFWTIAFFLLCATTVHPWYFLPLLALAAVRARPAWPWQWLALCSIGTYLFYAPIPASESWYWLFVIAGWGGAAGLAVWLYGTQVLRQILRWRARRKASRVAELLPEQHTRRPRRLLDLGAAEGFVGAALDARPDTRVVLADVGDYNETGLPYHVYDGQHLPFPDDAFDGVVLYFVLHHAEDPGAIVREAMRVATGRVIVVESVFSSEGQHRLLRRLDQWANRFRCGGAMEEGALHLRKAGAWRMLIEKCGGRILYEDHRGRWVHRQAFFVVAPP